MSKVKIILTGEMMPVIKVEGQPIPAERVRRGRGGRFYVPTRTREWRDKVTTAAYNAWGIKDSPTRDPVAMMTLFRRTGKRDCDLDNLQKSVQDALLGLAFVDDAQVKVIFAVKETEAAEGMSFITLMHIDNIKVEEINGKKDDKVKSSGRRKVARN